MKTEPEAKQTLRCHNKCMSNYKRELTKIELASQRWRAAAMAFCSTNKL